MRHARIRTPIDTKDRVFGIVICVVDVRKLIYMHGIVKKTFAVVDILIDKMLCVLGSLCSPNFHFRSFLPGLKEISEHTLMLHSMLYIVYVRFYSFIVEKHPIYRHKPEME